MSAEEDMIALSRRLLRTNFSFHVINIALRYLPTHRTQPAQIKLLQEFMLDMARSLRGELKIMMNGDAFLILRADQIGDIRDLCLRIQKGMIDEGDPGYEHVDVAKLVELFRVPADYAALRERTDAYQAAATGGPSLPGGAPQVEMADGSALSGPLTTVTAGRIIGILDTIEITPFIRQQTVYQSVGENRWKALFVEYYTSFLDLKEKHFPNVDYAYTDPLFMKLCRALDVKVLRYLGENLASLNRRLSLNIAIETIFDPVYDWFNAHVPPEARGEIYFEINRMDIFNDVNTAVRAIAMIKRDGYKVALDGVTLDLLPYVRLNKFNADLVKIHLNKGFMDLLRQQDCVSALRALAPESIVFSRVDQENAIKVGQAFGLSKFQGWLIDEVATAATAGQVAAAG